MPEAWRWRLGVRPRGEPHDGGLITAMEKALHAADTPIDRFFFDAFGGALPDAAPYAGEAFADLRGRLSGYAPRAARDHAARRSGVEGESVAGCGDGGGGRVIKRKKNKKK